MLADHDNASRLAEGVSSFLSRHTVPGVTAECATNFVMLHLDTPERAAEWHRLLQEDCNILCFRSVRPSVLLYSLSHYRPVPFSLLYICLFAIFFFLSACARSSLSHTHRLHPLPYSGPLSSSLTFPFLPPFPNRISPLRIRMVLHYGVSPLDVQEALHRLEHLHSSSQPG